MDSLAYRPQRRVKPDPLGSPVAGREAVWVLVGNGVERNVPVLPWPLPQSDGAVVLRRPERGGPDDPAGWRAGGRLELVEVLASELVRVGLSLGRSVALTTVVLCPPGVSPGLSALALAVGDLLYAGRDGVRRVVMCAVCPAGLGLGRAAVPHEVSVRVGGSVQVRRVWELLSWADVPGWLDDLAAWPVAV